MKLVWSQRAASDRLAVFVWLAEHDTRMAANVDEKIEQAAQKLIASPESGSVGQMEGTRELAVAQTPYVAPYQILGDTVRLLRLIHSERMWPHDIPPKLEV